MGFVALPPPPQTYSIQRVTIHTVRQLIAEALLRRQRFLLFNSDKLIDLLQIPELLTLDKYASDFRCNYCGSTHSCGKQKCENCGASSLSTHFRVRVLADEIGRIDGFPICCKRVY